MRSIGHTLATLLLMVSSASVVVAHPVATSTAHARVPVGGKSGNARFEAFTRGGADVAFRTETQVRLTPRYRWLPAIIAGFSATWTQGAMTVGAAWAGRFIGAIGPTPAADRGEPSQPQGDGRYGWSLYDAGPEVKLAWTLGRFRPYVGAGFDVVYGRLDSVGNSTRPEVEDPRGQGRPTSDRTRLQSGHPTRYLVRPHVGVDVAFGSTSLGVQADYAMLPTSHAPRRPSDTGPGVLMVTAAWRGTF